MNAVPALETMLATDGAAGVQDDLRERAAAVVAACLAAFPSVEKGARVAFLMRVGNAPPPTALVRRLPLHDSLAAAAAEAPAP
jgi:hypothetical protein